MRVLIIEDEPGVASFVSRGLAEAGHEPAVAVNGTTGLEMALNHSFDALVLDLVLPGITGLEVCRQFREARGYDLPIIMLTALGSTEDIVAGLKAGGDDYLVKPFKFRELLARLEALHRGRTQPDPNRRLTAADLEVDLESRLVKRDGKPIRLTAREYELLVYLMRHQGRILSRESILSAVWEMDWDVETNVVDVYINYLRNKVDKPFDRRLIQTVVGMGYILSEEALT